MFAYKLKNTNKKDSGFVEGYKLTKVEWYCSNTKIKKLEENSLVECKEFKGYQIPQDLLDMLKQDVVVNETKVDIKKDSFTKDDEKLLEEVKEKL